MLLRDQLHRAAAHQGHTIALVADQRRLSYAELAAEADRAAGALARIGVAPGDRVVVFLPNSVEAIVSLYAVWRAGGVVVMADAESTVDHLAYRVAHSGAVAVVTSAAKLPVARAALDRVDHQRPAVLVVDDTPLADGEFALSEAAPVAGWSPPDVDVHAPAAIIYTSGSTGSPKGVTHSHHSIGVVVAAVGEYLHHDADDVVLCVLQLAFGYGLLQVLVTFQHGGRLVLRRGFGLPRDLVNLIAEERITGLAGVPTLFAMLRELGPESLSMCSSIRYLTCAAAAMPATLALQVHDLFPHADLFVMHGQTECLRTTYLPPELLTTMPHSVGRGMPGVELWLEDDAGSRLPDGSEGELVVRGDNVMLGYWRDPDATARVVRPGRSEHERVLRTGDLFRSDADGWLSFVSRTDDIIKTRGEKVSPHEIELVLAACDEIAECRVLGVADDVLGQAVRAEIVLRAGRTLSEHDVKRRLRAALEPYKMPRDIAFVDALPKSTSGKVLRR